MKKLLIVLILTLLLTGCGADKSNYEVTNTIIITDAKIEMIEVGGKFAYVAVIYSKDDQKSDEIKIKYDVWNDIANLKKTDNLIGEEEQLFDIVTDGTEIYAISLSKNRK